MRLLTSTRLVLLLLLALLALASPGAALAQGEDVIRDCAQDGDLDGDYSQEELDEAYDNLPSDIDEYSDCRTVIEKARERNDAGGNNDAGSDPGDTGSGGGTTGDGSGDGRSDLGGAGNDRDELREREQRSESGQAPGTGVAGESLGGGTGGTLESDDESDGMPAALVIAIILAALAALGGLLYLFRDRLPESIASRLPGSLKG
jgi:hypothetical protein